MFELAAQRVPFEGNSIQELYRKIDRGIFGRIPSRYSKELYNIIKLCLTRDEKRRPTVVQLLRHPVIKEKMEERNMILSKEAGGLNKLMNTIKLPKNMDRLIERLPRKKYQSSKSRATSAEPRKSRMKYSSEKQSNPDAKFNL